MPPYWMEGEFIGKMSAGKTHSALLGIGNLNAERDSQFLNGEIDVCCVHVSAHGCLTLYAGRNETEARAIAGAF
jgi:hypothetical protein